MKCMRCHRETRNIRAGLGPICARIVLGQLVKKREKAAEQQTDKRQMDLLEAMP